MSDLSTILSGSTRLVAIPTGEAREAKVWPDGSYTCPWCGCGVASPNHPTYVEAGEYPRYVAEAYEAGGCPNPTCWARVSPPYPVEAIERDRAAREARRREQEREAERSRRWAEYQAAEQAAAEALWKEVSAEAARRGACRVCLARSLRQFGRPKYVRHRTANFHEGRR